MQRICFIERATWDLFKCWDVVMILAWFFLLHFICFIVCARSFLFVHSFLGPHQTVCLTHKTSAPKDSLQWKISSSICSMVLLCLMMMLLLLLLPISQCRASSLFRCSGNKMKNTVTLEWWMKSNGRIYLSIIIISIVRRCNCNCNCHCNCICTWWQRQHVFFHKLNNSLRKAKVLKWTIRIMRWT